MSLLDLFDEAQNYVYREMEHQLLGAFLRSDDGHHYLQALVHRDLCMMSKTPYVTDIHTDIQTEICITMQKLRVHVHLYV